MTSRAMRPLSLTVRLRLRLGDDGAKVGFGCVGDHGSFRSLEHAQQFALVGAERMWSCRGWRIRSAFEDAVEPRSQFGCAFRAGGELERLELTIEPPIIRHVTSTALRCGRRRG